MAAFLRRAVPVGGEAVCALFSKGCHSETECWTLGWNCGTQVQEVAWRATVRTAVCEGGVDVGWRPLFGLLILHL